jgi:hypothetical protein
MRLIWNYVGAIRESPLPLYDFLEMVLLFPQETQRSIETTINKNFSVSSVSLW